MDEFSEPSPDETRQVMRQVAAYRRVCEQVRRKAIGTMVNGFILLGLWYVLDGMHPARRFDLFSMLFLGLAVLDIAVGLLNRFFPTAEGILLDGVVLLGFAASNGVRAFIFWQAGQPYWINALFGVFWTIQAVNILRSYGQIVRGMPARPTRAHLRWFNGLLADLRAADPKDDPRAMAIPTDPFLTGLLLGDTAFFLDQTGEVLIVARERVTVEAEDSPDPDRPPRGYLTIEGVDFPPFKLSRANWENYVAWKREGGEDPLTEQSPVPVVRPRG